MECKAIRQFKSSFAHTSGLHHLNNGGLSPITKEALEAVQHWSRRYWLEGMFCNDDYLDAMAHGRGQVASLLGSQKGEVAFFQSTAGAISQVAFQCGLQPGDEVLMWSHEYSSNLYPWKAACDRSGASLRLVPPQDDGTTPWERLAENLTDRTKILAFSWVQFASGAVTDLEPLIAVTKAKGVRTVVDIFQGFGVLPFDFEKLGVDAVCGGSHKWLCSPVGVGYLCIKQDWARQMRPHIVGAYTYGTCEDPSDLSCAPKNDALRFEAGSKQVLEIVALGASCERIQRTGTDVLRSEIQRLGVLLKEGLMGLGYHVQEPNGKGVQKGGFVCVAPTDISPLKSVDAMQERLTSARVSHARRGIGIRLTPHAHTGEEAISRALDVLRGR